MLFVILSVANQWSTPEGAKVKYLDFYAVIRFFTAFRMTKQRFVIDEFCSNRSNVALPPLRQ